MSPRAAIGASTVPEDAPPAVNSAPPNVTHQPPANEPDNGALTDGMEAVADEEPARPAAAHKRVRPAQAAEVPEAPLKLPAEERIYSTISRAFVAVENWFDRFGSPTSTDTPRRAAVHRQHTGAGSDSLSFPRLHFTTGSAELSAESQIALCDLAARLTADKTAAVIEIRGHGIEDGPEAFRYILSQARAQAVRDFLVNEGVNIRKLTTHAVSSDQRDSTKAAIPIEFVVRR